MKLPNYFLAGCQKSASTWIYHCLKEHPEIFVPDNDANHYFTINYYKGIQWYEKIYAGSSEEAVVVDPTPSYLRDILAPQRIYNYNPDSKFIFSLRNPIDRAFSHYWHEKKKNKINFTFDEAVDYSGIGNYDLYCDWILTGFYYEWIRNYLALFPKENMLFLIFDDLIADPGSYVKSIYKFAGVDTEFVPLSLNQTINKASGRVEVQTFTSRLKDRAKRRLGIKSKPVLSEYEKGMDPGVRQKLAKIFEDEIAKLENFLGRDLSIWKS